MLHFVAMLQSVTLAPRDDLLKFAFLHREPARTAAASNITYIDNGVIRVGVDLTRGGSIGFVADSKNLINVINCHDMGREVQLSFYANPAVYNPPTASYPNGACDKLFQHADWPWNPIGAGDIDGNHGEVLSVTSTNTSIHLVTRPLQWACHRVACECTFEQRVTLDGTGVRVEATLHNTRTDTFTPQPRDQELPAVYTNAPYYRILTYTGDEPFTHGPTTDSRPHLTSRGTLENSRRLSTGPRCSTTRTGAWA